MTTRKIKSHKIKRKQTTKTVKNIKINKKERLIKNIIKEWKHQTNGKAGRDTEGHYINDYYLYFRRKNSFYYHIHLVLHNFVKTHSFYDNFLYILKKYDTYKNQIVHSKKFKIGISSDPKEVVKDMISEYKEFIKSN